MNWLRGVLRERPELLAAIGAEEAGSRKQEETKNTQEDIENGNEEGTGTGGTCKGA